MDLPEANSTSYCRHDLYCRPVSSLPLSVMVFSCHACVNLRVVFISWALRRHCTLAVALHRHNSGLGISHARKHLRTFGLHEILKCAHLKFTVYGRKQTDIHTTSANAVTLVWSSLRLAPTMVHLFYKQDS